MTPIDAGWRVTQATVCVGLLLLVGCRQPTGSVSGRVTYQGQPVVLGQVAITSMGGTPRFGVIGLDGTYKVAGLPIGKAIVTVVSPDPAQKDPEKAPDDDAPRPAGWFPLPAQFANRAESGLSLEVQSGPQEYPLDLK